MRQKHIAITATPRQIWTILHQDIQISVAKLKIPYSTIRVSTIRLLVAIGACHTIPSVPLTEVVICFA